jgi:hypothetical protein
MSRGIVKVLRANGSIILEATISSNMRIQIPSNLKAVVNPPLKVKVTIERLDGKKP